MSWQYVTIERHGRVAVVRFDRGHRLNALSRALLRELTEAARSFETDHATTAVVLAGRDDAFSAGFDLADAENKAVPDLPLEERRTVLAWGPRLCRAWAELEPLTICAIEGYCIGGGVSLALACDLRIMGAGAHFRVPELSLGMNMSWQTLPRLAHLVGPARAKRIVIFAEAVDAETAAAWGLADEVVADGGAAQAARDLAEKAARMPNVPVRMTKAAIDQAVGALDHATSYMDRDQYALSMTGDDFSEGMAAYLEKRDPEFTGG